MLATTDLDSYLLTYGGLLGQTAATALAPLHIPTRDAPLRLDLRRSLLDAQAHVGAAGVKQLDRDSALLLVAEMGTGKTIMSIAIAHAHAAGKPYRAIVMCPPQLPNKWIREIHATLPDVDTYHIRSLSDLVGLNRHEKPTRSEWWLISETTAKNGAAWEPAYVTRNDSPILRCPSCFQNIVDKHDVPVGIDKLGTSRQWCEGTEYAPGCGGPLWTFNNSTERWAPATYIHKKLRGYFKYFICDELHEEKSPTSARANAMGSIAAACEKFIGLTGTLVGGYAWHLRTILFRTSPSSLVSDGFTWSNVTDFNQTYGRIETRINEKESAADDNKQSKGSTTRTQSVQPGIMPSLFGKHLMDKCVFLSLNQVSSNLPVFKEEVIPVTMDAELASAYGKAEQDLRVEMAKMLQRNDRRLLGAMLNCLMAYPDHPYDWDDVGYWNTTGQPPRLSKQFVPVTRPRNLSYDTIRNKEQALFDRVLQEYQEGRQVWVYTTMTGQKNVADMLAGIARESGLNSKVLRATVPTHKREEWIDEHGPGTDFMASHPQLVRTGLDLFGKHHNFVTILFYLTGFDLFTMRQAARRSWRIGQTEECRVAYFYYKGTAQERAMTLMGRKLAASESIEGKFSSEGLAAMAGEDGSIEMALAKSLVNQLDDLNAQLAWNKVTSEPAGTKQTLNRPLHIGVQRSLFGS